MRFRTEIEAIKGVVPIDYSSQLLMLGSCFTDEVGRRLQIDGFDVVYNPMGPLYNPASIARVIERALNSRPYTELDLTSDGQIRHLLDFASRYQGADASTLLMRVNEEFQSLAERIRSASTWIITFGTARVFELDGETIVGNCHKLPASRFVNRMLSIDEIVELWKPLLGSRRVIFTISPIRHIADGLHGNQLSKARLQLAVEALCTHGAEYFPAYEIMIDDLRDYRFYAADMKHPSDVAVDYIYSKLSETYFTAETRNKAAEARRVAMQSLHRPILNQ